MKVATIGSNLGLTADNYEGTYQKTKKPNCMHEDKKYDIIFVVGTKEQIENYVWRLNSPIFVLTGYYDSNWLVKLAKNCPKSIAYMGMSGNTFFVGSNSEGVGNKVLEYMKSQCGDNYSYLRTNLTESVMSVASILIFAENKSFLCKQIYEECEKLNADYNVVRELIAKEIGEKGTLITKCEVE